MAITVTPIGIDDQNPHPQGRFRGGLYRFPPRMDGRRTRLDVIANGFTYECVSRVSHAGSASVRAIDPTGGVAVIAELS